MKRHVWIESVALLRFATVVVFLVAPEVHAQFLGHNLPGDFGLVSGSQAPPGRYAGIIVPYYRSDTIRLEDDRSIEGRPGSEIELFSLAPLVTFVTDFQLFGGNYGAVVVPSFTNTSLEIPRFDVDQDQFGFGDLYVVPFQLGWHWERTDVIASYGFFAPTGSYDAGADDNIGLGMWSHELAAGFTQYLDAAKTWHVATTAFYEVHTTKRDTDIRIGDLLFLEGGIGKNFGFASGSSLGAAYYAAWQTTDASGEDVPVLLRGRRIRGFGLGPEVQLLQGTIVVRALWEFGVRNNLEGFILVGSLALPF